MMSDNLLFELVNRYSPSGEEHAASAYLIEWMRAHGFDAYLDEVGNPIGVREGPPDSDSDHQCTLMLLGHIDTVPGAIPVRRLKISLERR